MKLIPQQVDKCIYDQADTAGKCEWHFGWEINPSVFARYNAHIFGKDKVVWITTPSKDLTFKIVRG